MPSIDIPYLDDLDSTSVAAGAALGIVGALLVTALYPKDVYSLLQTATQTTQTTTKALARAVGIDSQVQPRAFDFNMVPHVTVLA